MPGQELARQWFVPADGIDRHVITADIQRYLGNDATVRPGRGTERGSEGVEGYWIRAYRNLTSAMISDLRADSSRWRQERAATGGKESYVNSQTYERGNAAANVAASRRREADSPSMVESPYGAPSARGGRGQSDRSREVDAMQIDPPSAQSHSDRGRYGHAPSSRGGYQPAPEVGGYPAPGRDAGRDRYQEPGRGPAGRPVYQEDQPMMDAYGRQPASAPYAPDPRYGGNPPPSSDGPPPGYVREGNYYVPITSGYGQPPVMSTSRPEVQQYPSGPYGQPAEPPRDSRRGEVRGEVRGDMRGDPRADPRYAQEYNNDARYYPSPATTAASVNNRDTISSPPGPPSSYNTMPPQYSDPYGRPVAAPQIYGAPEPAYGQPSRDMRDSRDTREPAYGQRAPVAPPANDRDRDNRRRRLH